MDKQGNDKKINQQLNFHKKYFLAEMFKIEIFVDEEIDRIQKHQESGNYISAIITQIGLENHIIEGYNCQDGKNRQPAQINDPFNPLFESAQSIKRKYYLVSINHRTIEVLII
jgi:hypothetical protein